MTGKNGRKVMQAAPVGGVGGVPSMICVVPACSEIISSPRTLVSHWADCHVLYVWYYYCTWCKSQQKHARMAVVHMKDHEVQRSHHWAKW